MTFILQNIDDRRQQTVWLTQDRSSATWVAARTGAPAIAQAQIANLTKDTKHIKDTTKVLYGSGTSSTDFAVQEAK